MMSGKFITLEGGEGAGKSTQVKRLVSFLESRGIQAVQTREVGGCPSAEEIRALWLGAGAGHWDPLTEVMLVMAARREHLVRTVWPALAKGYWVVSDRYVDSTRAYQGYGLGLDLAKIDTLYAEIAGNFWPDMTMVLDLPVDVGLARMAARRGPDDRYQQQDVAFHNKLRTAFQDMAKQEPLRFRLIDASLSADEVSRDMARKVAEHFGLTAP